jgi:flagellar hook-length control protein FliK
LIAGETGALLPGMASPEGAAVPAGAAAPFGDLLRAAVAGADLPAEAQDALLAELIAQAPLEELPAILHGLGFAVPEGVAWQPLDDGNSSPLTGNPLPAALQDLVRARFATAAQAAQALRPDVASGADALLVDVPDGAALPAPTRNETQVAALFAPTSATPSGGTGDAEPQLDPMILRLIAGKDTPLRDTPRAATAGGATQRAAQDPLTRVFSDLAKVLIPARAGEAAEGDTDLALTTALRRDLGAARTTGADSALAAPTIGVPGPFEATVGALRSGRGELTLPQPPTHPAWPEAFSERVTFAVTQQLQQAELRLNPPQLGHIELRISLVQDQASISFSSQHVAVREAIEAALPRLRESLADAGLNLVNVDVSDRSLAHDRRGAWAEQAPSRPTQLFTEFEVSPEAPVIFHGADGRIDYFA